MALEIERKFLVRGDAWREGARGERYVQGYLCASMERSVRVRIEGDRARLNVKGPRRDRTNLEFEYPIPIADAEELLAAVCRQPPIEKTRYHLSWAGKLWEIDEFAGANAGLVVAEIELGSADESFELPPWTGREVTEDRRYWNVSLVTRPYALWRDEAETD